MAQMGSDSIAILATAAAQPRNRDVEYPYRGDSDFLYLTGFSEPEALLVLIPDQPTGRFLLFCRERDPERELWEGRRAGIEGAVRHFGADEAYPIDQIDELIPPLLADRQRVYYPIGVNEGFDAMMMGWLNQLRQQSRSGTTLPHSYIPIERLLHEMRLHKSAAELAVMRHAAALSAAAHCRAMQRCRPGLYEYQLEAEIQHHCADQGARHAAYPAIVGGGANGCILHYTDNSDLLQAGDLVLIDAGAEYHHYAADITRTFPVNGRFSPAQRQLYELVLAAQEAAIGAVRPGASWNDPHAAAVAVLAAGMVELGLLRGLVDRVIEQQRYRRYFMHRTGHWLGMDVHDVGEYKVDGAWRPLAPGMVLTIEPGIYIPADDRRVAKRWRGIGIRIEDDVVVTEQGCEVLTEAVPKRVAAIEALMAEGRRGE